MVQKPKSFVSYQADILTRLVNSGIRQLAPGGKARAICDALADELGAAESRQFLDLGETLLPFATGSNLDLIGEIYGVPRISQQSASVDQSDGNFRFYVRAGTFGAINLGQDIVIPADVQITTADDNGPVYLTDPVVLPADQNQAYFSARSLYAGTVSNAPSRVFNRHNFSNYSDSRYGSLLVTNDYGVVGGRDTEDDESYRYRIHLKLTSQSGSNEAALRFALLQISGIQDVVFDRQAGTFTVYVYGVTPVASSSLLSTVQEVLDNTVAYPLSGVAVTPDLVGISLATTLTLTAGATQTDRDTVAAQAVIAAQNYLNNLGVGGQLVVNEIADQIRNASPKILDVGSPGKELLELFIWRSRNDGTRYSRSLISNYIPTLGERIGVEDRAGAVAITVV